MSFGADIGNAHTEPKAGVGDEINVKGTVYKYVQANGAIDQFAACIVDDDGQLAEVDTATSAARANLIGIPQIALADNQYGWVPVGPFREGAGFRVLAAGSISADTNVTTTATFGTVGAGGDTIAGLYLTVASGAGGATACHAVTRLTTNV